MPLFFTLFFLLLFAIHYLFCSRVIKKLLLSPSIQKRLMFLVCLNFLFNILYVLARYTSITGNTFYYLFSLSIGITFVDQSPNMQIADLNDGEIKEIDLYRVDNRFFAPFICSSSDICCGKSYQQAITALFDKPSFGRVDTFEAFVKKLDHFMDYQIEK